MATLCDGCSRILSPAEEDGALSIRDAVHRYRLCTRNGCAPVVLGVVEHAILDLRHQHARSRISWRARNLDIPGRST